jgi:hypothetical protein
LEIRSSRYLLDLWGRSALFPKVADEFGYVGGNDDDACYKEAQYKCHTNPESTEIKDAFHNASVILKCIGKPFLLIKS